MRSSTPFGPVPVSPALFPVRFLDDPPFLTRGSSCVPVRRLICRYAQSTAKTAKIVKSTLEKLKPNTQDSFVLQAEARPQSPLFDGTYEIGSPGVTVR